MRFGLVAIARPTFDVAFAQETAQCAAANLTDAGYEIVGSPNLSMDSASLAVALKRLTASGDVPVVLWAFPEDRTGGRLRLNSFCGINLAGYALTNIGRDYRWLYRAADHPDAPSEIRGLLAMDQRRSDIAAVQDSVGFSSSARRAAEMARERLRSITIGRVGDRPDGFEPCGYRSEVLGEVLGVTVDEIPLPVLFERWPTLPHP